MAATDSSGRAAAADVLCAAALMFLAFGSRLHKSCGWQVGVAAGPLHTCVSPCAVLCCAVLRVLVLPLSGCVCSTVVFLVCWCCRQVGMVCSNEPGYYEDGGFGIRIENLLTIEEAGTEFRCVSGARASKSWQHWCQPGAHSIWWIQAPQPRTRSGAVCADGCVACNRCLLVLCRACGCIVKPTHCTHQPCNATPCVL